MENQTKTASNEVSLRTLDIALIVIAVIVTAALIFITHKVSNSYAEMKQATEDYISWQESATDMKLGSAYLTDQARNFAMTANVKYLNNYFEEAYVTRRRGNAVAALRTELLDDTDAQELLQTSLSQSTELMVTELYTMRLVIDANGYNVKNYPETLQHTSIKWLDSLLTPEKKIELARSMLYEDEYIEKKAQIDDNVQTCIDMLVQKTAERQQNAIEEARYLLTTHSLLVGLLFALIAATAMLTAFLMIRPLYRAIGNINANKPISVGGARELRFLARAYNSVLAATQQRTKQLAYDATHDKLTGVYNRNGYEALREQMDYASSAILILDIDEFKKINDTYGHDAGDRILSRVSSVLALSFRADDPICRIGGDEFVVLMSNTGLRHKTLIRKKIQQINDTLQMPIGDLPPVSISVGVAFGESYTDGDDCFKAADEALYTVKNGDRRGVCFAS
ncbi:MAG: GGDEF domain-containing protein [Oscillospiraceae bacterium]|nr:GGDEF domain-containing protein [Oscillospiraceae bacterium]